MLSPLRLGDMPFTISVTRIITGVSTPLLPDYISRCVYTICLDRLMCSFRQIRSYAFASSKRPLCSLL